MEAQKMEESMTLFHDCSRYIFDWMESQNHVKEESLTDWLLYNISRQCDFIYYQAFSRHEEAQNGSDWEWWILVPDSKGSHEFNAYRFVVQAKKLLSHNKDNYSIINYGNKYGMQIDLLLDFARDRNALPLYMYYSIGKPDILEQIRNVHYISGETMRWCEDCINGCYLSFAVDVYDLLYGAPRKKILDGQLLNYSFKLSLLDKGLGHYGFETDDILNNFNNKLLERNATENFTYSKDGIYGIKHNEKTIPRYVQVFIQSRQEKLDWFENEMRITDIAGLGVIDLRSNLFN